MNTLVDTARVEMNDLFPRAKEGDQAAWQDLVTACYPKVLRAVRRRLTSRAMRSIYDSADFANDVLKSLAANSDRYDFPNLDALIAFLTEEAMRKVLDEVRKHHALKRDVTRQRPIAGMMSDDGGPCDLASTDPTPSKYAQAEETRARLLLGQPEDQRRVIELKQKGYTNEEIAKNMGWHVRKVQRFLKHLHDSWSGGGPGARA